MSASTTPALWLAACAALLAAAVWRDVATQRIPNALVLAGAAAGLLLSLLPGGVGMGSAAAGLGLGFALFLPLYLLRAMGAGDVKLLAALGAFTGSPGVIVLALFTLLAGGLLSLLWAVATRSSGSVARNVHIGLITVLARVSSRQLPRAGDLPASAPRIPYAVAIAAGMAAYLLWSNRLGFTNPL